MPYCVNCGQPYERPARYCRGCGLSLSSTSGSFASDSEDTRTRALSSERTYWHLRRKQRYAEESNDSLRLYMSFVGVIAIIHGISLIGGSGFGKLLNGPLGWLLLAGVFLGATFKLVFDLRYGYSAARSLLEIILFGLLVYGAAYGIFWYLHELSLSPSGLWSFGAMATPTP